MKKITALVLALICLLSLTACSSRRFLENINAEDVATISVFNGSTGQRMVLDNKEEISKIVESIQSAEMKRGKRSSNYDGYVFSLTFKDKNGNVIDGFIINSTKVIRDDPYFYECENGELCYAFLQELESKYCADE